MDQTARMAAQLTHIQVAMEVLKEFINMYEINSFGSVSFDVYYRLADFVQTRYPPSNSTFIEITGKMNTHLHTSCSK